MTARSTYRLPVGSILTITALVGVVIVQDAKDASFKYQVSAVQALGPFTVERTFIVSGNASAAIADAVADEPLSLVSITANTTITRLHANKVLQVNSGSDVTLTLAAELPAGFSFLVDQVDAGLAIFAVASGASKVNRQSFDRTAGAGALMTAYVRSNADGASAVWLLGGDGATA